MRLLIAGRALGAMVLLIAVSVAYVPAILGGGFVWDDDHNLTGNVTLRTFDGLVRIWTENTVPPWYPLFHTALWVQYRVWGEHPLGYHLVNVLLHGLNALLVWRLLDRLGARGAWLAALAWALHPVQVESVAWITELKNVLSGTFYFAAAWVWLRAEGPELAAPVGRRSRHEWLAFGLFAAALLTKTVTATLPVALLVVVWWKRGAVGWRHVLRLLPWFGLAAVLGLATVWQERALGAVGSEWAANFASRVIVAGRALAFYVLKLVWPDPILFVYPRWQIDPSVASAWFNPAGAVALLALLWLARSRIGRAPLAGVLFFVLTLAPTLGFLDVYYTRYSQVADRWQYLACIGLIALAAAAVTRMMEDVGPLTKAAGVLPIAALLSLYGAVTWVESRHYANAETLWRATLAENPRAFAAHTNLGILLMRRGEGAEAEQHFRSAVEIAPDFTDARNNLGILLHSRGALSEAIAEFERAIAARPGFADALNNLGIALAAEGRLEEAERRFREAVSAAPGMISARRNLGVLLLERGRPAEAMEQFRAMAEFAPDLGEARLRMAETAAALGDAHEALNSYREVLALEPDSAEAALGLAWLLATLDDRELRDGREALRLAESVLARRGPRDARAWDVVGAAHAELGDFPRAVEAARRAADLAEEAGAVRYAREIGERRVQYEREGG